MGSREVLHFLNTAKNKYNTLGALRVHDSDIASLGLGRYVVKLEPVKRRNHSSYITFSSEAFYMIPFVRMPVRT